MKFLGMMKKVLETSDSVQPSLQRKESQAYKKKMEKYAKWSQLLVSNLVEEDGATYIKIAPKHQQRVKRLD